jgi:mannosyltransferase OCH1-like enzyme
LGSDGQSRAAYREQLAAARKLIEAGQLDEARDALDALTEDDALMGSDMLGQHTVLGVPRRLHSAYLKLAKAEDDPVARIGLQHGLVPDPALLEPFGQFDLAQTRHMTELGRTSVPRVIHQIWLGSLDLPPSTARWAEHARKTGFDYRLWREADLEALGILEHPSYRQMLQDGDYPGAVDVARYAVLHALGGIYIDCDWYPTRNDLGFADLLPLVGFTALAEDTPRDTGRGSLLLTNSLLASPPGHPVFARLLEVMPQVMGVLPGEPAWWSTGPLILTVLARSTSVCVADAGLVAGNLPRRAPLEDVEAACSQAVEQGHSLLLGWKSW